MGILEDHINNYTRFEQPAVQSTHRNHKQEKIGNSLSHYLCDLDENMTEQLNRDMLVELKNNLSNVLFQEEYTYTHVTQFLAHMYESIEGNPIILKALDQIKKMDEYTFTHSVNTAFYSMFIAMWMDLDEQDIINATQAGFLHDIGKIYIPEEILNKSGVLTREEYEIIQLHPFTDIHFSMSLVRLISRLNGQFFFIMNGLMRKVIRFVQRMITWVYCPK